MIIKNILLNNIRSYKDPPPIQLTTGVTLFEGDVGCGKSTILSAIEFGLFGLGEIDGAYLLRHGERTGSVQLEFEVTGKEYKVYRSLERKRINVSQKEGYIVEEGVKTSYSVSEMKSRVLKILNFNENPRPNTSSLIYRYAVFTPQEMMKEVLFQQVDRRLETLRRAFKIEDYNIVNNNASILLTWLGNESKFLERQTEDIDEKRESLEQENQKVITYTNEYAEIDEAVSLLEEELREILKEIEQLQAGKEQVQTLQTEIPLIDKDLSEKVILLENIKKRITRLTSELSKINEAEKNQSEINPVYAEYNANKLKVEQLEPLIEEIQKLTTQKSTLTSEIANEKAHLEGTINDLQKELIDEQQKITKQKNTLLRIPEFEKIENQLLKEVDAIEPLSTLLETQKKEHSEILQDVKNKKNRLKELKGEFEELTIIGLGAPCPKCKQKLTAEHYKKVELDYLKEFDTFEKSILVLNTKASVLNTEIEKNEKKKNELKESDRKLNKLKPELAKLLQQEETSKDAEESYDKKQKILQQKQTVLTQETYKQKEKQQLAEAISRLEQLEPIKKEYSTIKERIKALEKLKIEEQYLNNKSRICQKNDVSTQLKEEKAAKEELDIEIESKKNLLAQKRTEFEEKKPILEAITKLEKNRDTTNRNREDMTKERVIKKKDIDASEEEVERIRSEITAREKHLLKLDELNQYYLWLSEMFIPAVNLIEKNVLSNINNEFNLLFQKWFGHLLETGDITVRVNDNFTPIIEQNGYEMDVGSLSGGEKTSVALAYRLALNVMVKKVCEAMQSNLLILDEPTDGFSKEQLFRLRDILNELKCEQVITVSHENELEGFVDKIYRITKEAGESKIVQA